MQPLPPLAPQLPAASAPRSTSVPVVVPQQLQCSPAPRTLLPRLQLSPAHLSAAVAVVASQPVTSPLPRHATTSATKKPLKRSAPSSRTRLVLPAPLLAAATAAAMALVSGDGEGNDSATSPTHSAASSSSATQQYSTTTNGNRATRKMKKCSIQFCESYARSRGLCKAHGGGKRCKRPGCEVSDQGGGFCIRHGGGKRCLFNGCDKSAQSRHYCKAHGGGARCNVIGCDKSSQGGGLCRAHGGGPRRKRVVNTRGERIESPRTAKRTKFRAELAARALVGAAQAIAAQEAQSELSQHERIECEPGSTSLAFTIRRPIENRPTILTRGRNAPDGEVEKEKEKAALDGLGGEEHDTHLFVAASLLGMQTASAE